MGHVSQANKSTEDEVPIQLLDVYSKWKTTPAHRFKEKLMLALLQIGDMIAPTSPQSARAKSPPHTSNTTLAWINFAPMQEAPNLELDWSIAATTHSSPERETTFFVTRAAYIGHVSHHTHTYIHIYI